MKFSPSSVTDSSKRTENDESSLTGTTSSSKSLAVSRKLVEKFQEGTRTDFDLGNNNILSILKSKTDPVCTFLSSF